MIVRREKKKEAWSSRALKPSIPNGEEVPVWISDYVLANYGTGAVMAVLRTISATEFAKNIIY